MRMLVTGGTGFVSRYEAEWCVRQGHEVFVLNRGSRPQPAGVHLIQADRHQLSSCLRGLHFDAVVDCTAYTGQDVHALLNALEDFDCYVLISSSAVYPDTGAQPFCEDTPLGANRFWGAYGIGKMAAEAALRQRVPDAYVLRPPYLYGAMNNVYREAFVFECAKGERPFYVPGDGSLPLQFFHISDLCRLVDRVMAERPEEHILNTGNEQVVTVRDWVACCYRVAGREVEFCTVPKDVPQRSYFCFHDYAYRLDVTRQHRLLPVTLSLEAGLRDALTWLERHPDSVARRPYQNWIDSHLVPLRCR